jgi:hypothetical protein
MRWSADGPTDVNWPVRQTGRQADRIAPAPDLRMDDDVNVIVADAKEVVRLNHLSRRRGREAGQGVGREMRQCSRTGKGLQQSV